MSWTLKNMQQIHTWFTADEAKMRRLEARRHYFFKSITIRMSVILKPNQTWFHVNQGSTNCHY